MPVPDEVLRLVEMFESDKDAYKAKSYNEAQARVELVNPFFEALGWDMTNKSGSRQVHREVVHEYALKTDFGTKAPDYCFYVDDKPKLFVEAKKPFVSLRTDPKPAFQVRRYGWSAKLPLSVVTDFEELAVYDCRAEPMVMDKAYVSQTLYLKYEEYETRWDEIESLLSKEAVLGGSLERFVEEHPISKATATVDKAFLREISEWRAELAENIAALNRSLTQSQLNFAVQMTIDRILFLRICEARGIESRLRLEEVREERVNLYGKLCDIFREADRRYNSGLFHFRAGEEGADDLTLKVRVGDEALRGILRRLSPEYSPYAFAVMPVEILGQVYEQFLGKVIRLEPGGVVAVEEKPEVRKAGGVYYTPSYIVEYIVKETVGKLLDGKTPKEVQKLRILDPACGSGSFLLGAYQYLLNWHAAWYVKDGVEKHKKELDAVPGGGYRVSLEKRKSILQNSVFGVDIDTQAVEVTKLSLLLKVLEGETERTVAYQTQMYHEPALPDLDKNIKCGNSLIDWDFAEGRTVSKEELERVNPFSWESEFPAIVNDPIDKSRGFSIEPLSGPPYGLQRFSEVRLVYKQPC